MGVAAAASATDLSQPIQKTLLLPDFEYLGSYKTIEIKECFAHIALFLSALHTCDFEMGQKILFMRIQLETLQKQLVPFLTKLEELEMNEKEEKKPAET